LAVEYLHENNVLYRDLKAENTLIDSDGHIRLADFGMSKQLSDVSQPNNGGSMKRIRSNSFCGTVRYMAPEIIQQKDYGPGIDWWAFGILLFQMLTGKFPFESSSKENIQKSILNDEIKFPQKLSSNAILLLKGILNKEPNARYHSAQIKTHKFFSSIDFVKLSKKDIFVPFKPYLEDGEQDTGNFSSDLTGQSPKIDIVETDVPFKLEEFTYTSPSTDDFLHKKMKELNCDSNISSARSSISLSDEQQIKNDEEEKTTLQDIPEGGIFDFE